MTALRKDKAKPFDDIRALITSAPSSNEQASDAVSAGFDEVASPKPSIGNWEDPVKWLAGWQGASMPRIEKPLIAIFAGTHGLCKHYMNDDIIEAAKSRIKSLTEGSAAVRGIAVGSGAAFKVFEMGLEYPVPDITQDESLSEQDCAAAIAFGMEVVAEGADIIVLGNAGMGSATAAAAIAHGLYGGTAEYWAGAHNMTANDRIRVVKAATELQSGRLLDPLDCLRYFGGRDIAGLVGAIIAARHQSIPVILDGFVVCTAAAVLHKIDPEFVSHCQAGHLTAEPAHGALLDRIGMVPLHDFGIAVGDGTGAAYAMNSLKLSAAAYKTLMS